ncbi:MAG TPA: DUF4241 domain-containing protein, partial [Kofleriaceae bacterium]|nr:DUF4241 domain-containing protein [Kofleriaceae bacterium]
FARTVPPGKYRVELLELDRDQRFALARVVLAPGTPVRWELAVRPGEDVRALKPGQIYGYGVDAGTGCFVDGASVDKVRGEAVSNALLAAVSARPDGIARWPAAGDAVAIAFASGYGDGVYPSWWGLDATGRPVELVTDFHVGDFPRPTLPDDPAFRRNWAREQLANLRAGVARMARSAGNDGRDVAYTAVTELASLGDDAADVLPEVLKDLAVHQRDVVVADPLISLVRDLAEHEAMQPAIAAWLEQAPVDAADTFVLLLRAEHMRDDFARAVAQVAVHTPEQNLVQVIRQIDGVETGRDPFRPWLETVARRQDEAGQEARDTLARWAHP